MTWTAFFYAIRQGLQRKAAPAIRRANPSATAERRMNATNAPRTPSSHASNPAKKPKTVEDWDYRVIGLEYAWH